jgi:hypothetical protein
MLDVHPPEHTPHTWRDFFIHIATIVIGLLIAIGLEQTVEYIHHRHQVAETRRALHNERLMNIKRFAVTTNEFRRFAPVLENNLAIFVYLKQRPGAPASQWPGALDWNHLTLSFVDSAWNTAEHGDVVAYMPDPEVRADTRLYHRLERVSLDFEREVTALNDVERYVLLDPDPSHLSPAQLDRQIDLTLQAVLGLKEQANDQYNLYKEIPDFTPAPALADIVRMNHSAGTITPTRTKLNEILTEVYAYDKSVGDEDSSTNAKPR